MSKPKTIAVLGGGSAGFTAARMAREFGARVILALGHQGNLSSLCINAGCMPSKALFAPIDTLHHARAQRWLRIEPRIPGEYLAEIVAWKDRHIAGFRAYRDEAIKNLAGKDFLVLDGDAAFRDAHAIEVQGQRYAFDAAIIATGSKPVFPKIRGVAELRPSLWTNEEILRNTELPESLAVVGGGAVGLEFSLRYARLGTAVTLMTRSPGLLSGYAPEFGSRLQRVYEQEGIEVRTSSQVVTVSCTHEGLFSFLLETPAGTDVVVAERALLATGRGPMIESLNLSAAGIPIGSDQPLPIGSDMRVQGQAHLFAAGDVAGQRMVVHHAHIEAGIAAENAVRDSQRQWHKRSNLQVIFSDPEFAFAGLRPEEATAQGIRLATASAQSRDVGKLLLEGDAQGYGEIYADGQSGRLLGTGLLCRGASDLIHLPAYAIDHQHRVHELVDAEFYHPTRMEMVAEMGDALCRQLGGTPFCRALE